MEELSSCVAIYVFWSYPRTNYYFEAVPSYDLWIWHVFFGLFGSHNDINVLDRYFFF
jgi:hypothetical protein